MSKTAHNRKAHCSILHFRHYQKADGTHPVKLQLYYNDGNRRRKKQYSIGIDMTPEEFSKTWGKKNPRGQNLERKEELERIRLRAEDVARELEEFSFPAFEERFFNTPRSEKGDVFTIYEKFVQELKGEGRHKTAASYLSSLRKIQGFLSSGKKSHKGRLEFEEIDPGFLQDFEQWCTEELGHSDATVGVYLRNLKAVFNYALANRITENYPFGRYRYKEPKTKRTKKALRFEDLRTLAHAEPIAKDEEKRAKEAEARDLFMLSFYLYGMNLKDMAELRNRDIEEDSLKFTRSKTHRTNKENQREIEAPIDKRAKEILEKYRVGNGEPEAFALGIIDRGDTAEKKKRKIDAKVRFINQHLKPLSAAYGVDSRVSYQWARHTFATHSIGKGEVSMEFLSYALGHDNIETTQRYVDTLPLQQGRELMAKLTEDL